MADDTTRTASAGRQRVKVLRRCMILTGITLLLLPVVLCFILLGRMQRMNRDLEGLITQVEALTDIVSRQQEQMEELTEEVTATGAGSAENRLMGGEPASARNIVPEETGPAGEHSQEEAAGDGEQEKFDADETEDSPEITAAHKVYLTFDDGPSKYTGDILDILDRYNVKATFFVVGKESDSAKEAMQEIVARGHTLGMHSYSHKYAEIYSSVESFAEDYRRIRDYLYEVTGVESTVYRFPGGSSNTVSEIDMGEFADYLDTHGVRFFDWNIASGDGGAELLSVEKLSKNCTKDIERFETSVILMHDAASKSTTVEALPIIIENILALEDTVILPITEDTELVQHIQRRTEASGD